MSAQHTVTAAFVKVSIGSPSGNRVARILRRGDVVPEGVDKAQLAHLVERGMLEEIKLEPTSTGASTRGKRTSTKAKDAGKTVAAPKASEQEAPKAPEQEQSTPPEDEQSKPEGDGEAPPADGAGDAS
ncbi:hypothetical protein [Microbacterium sp. KNMS]